MPLKQEDSRSLSPTSLRTDNLKLEGHNCPSIKYDGEQQQSKRQEETRFKLLSCMQAEIYGQNQAHSNAFLFNF